MASHHRLSKPQSILSTPSKSIFRPHRTHLSFECKSFTSDPDIQDYLMTESFFKNLRFNKKFRIPSGITSLTFDSDQIGYRFRSKKIFADLLKEFRNLQSLKMTNVSFKDFSVLRKAFKSFRGLKNLEITFVGTSSAYERYSLEDFIKAFSPRLEQIKLDFPGYFYSDMTRGLDDNDRSHLRNLQIYRLNNLKKLSLSLPINSFLQDTGNLRYIDLSPMKRLDRLQSLDITLADHSTRMDREIDTEQLYFNPNKLFPNLTKFTWNVRSFSSLVPRRLELIGPQIASQLKYLDDFGLGFRHGTAKVYFFVLNQYLSTLKTDLNFLHFASNDSELSRQEAKNLFSALSLQRLKSLHTLSLEFKYCKGITNGFLGYLAQACAENFTGLRSLRLCFVSLGKEDGAKISSFLKAVFGIEGISDRGINNMGEILSKGCQDLEFLNLEFKGYSQISDKGVKSLYQKLNRLKKLKIVWIKFEDCENVIEMGREKAGKLLSS